MHLTGTKFRPCTLRLVPGREGWRASSGPGQVGSGQPSRWDPHVPPLMSLSLSLCFRLTAPKIPEGEKVDFDVS